MADSTTLKSKSKSSLAELVSVPPSAERGEKKSSPVPVALGNNEENAGNTVHGVTVNKKDDLGGYKLYRRRWLVLCESVALLLCSVMFMRIVEQWPWYVAIRFGWNSSQKVQSGYTEHRRCNELVCKWSEGVLDDVLIPTRIWFSPIANSST
jgi:hypothetical protein